MSSRDTIMRHLNIVGQLQPSLHQPQHAPYPDLVDNAHYRAYTRASHDVGGEADVPITWEEVLAWRGVWNAEERRRRQNVDPGQTIYPGLPYYGRWLMTIALILVDKQHVKLTDLIDKIEEVKQRAEANGGKVYE